MKVSAWAFAAILIATVLAGCSGAPSSGLGPPLGNGSTSAAGSTSSTPSTTSTAATSGPGPSDLGDFVPVYDPPTDPDYKAMEQGLRDGQALESIAEGLNGIFALPRDLKLGIGECGEANAFYDPSQDAVIICYELLESLATTFAADGRSGDELANAVAGAFAFVLFHELGHALQDYYDLPVTGPEEDAVDQLATVVLVHLPLEGSSPVIDAAAYWFLQAGASTSTTPPWDEHSPDDRRAFTILCLAYGYDPAAYAHLVGPQGLPASRAQRCGQEYSQACDAWSRLLEPWAKGEGDGPDCEPASQPPSMPPPPPSQTTTLVDETIAVPAGRTWAYTFTVQQAAALGYGWQPSDAGTVNIGFILAADVQAYDAGEEVTAWAFQAEVQQTSDGAALAPGEYALIVSCNNAFADCNGDVALVFQ